MTLWLEWKEKIFRHRQYTIWRLEGSPDSENMDWTPPGLELDRCFTLSIHPTLQAVTLDNLKLIYGATHFRTALQRYILLMNHPNMQRAELERQLDNIRIPFTHLPVWHHIKFLHKDPVTDKKSTSDSIHCWPSQVRKQGILPSRFDIALVNDGTGEDTGAENEDFFH
jgi:hypothetical protein